MAYTKYYIQVSTVTHVSFSAPADKYSALATDLGLLATPLAGSKALKAGTVFENGATRIKAVLANKKSVFLICDPDQLTNLLSGVLNGKACNGSTVAEVYMPLHRSLVP